MTPKRERSINFTREEVELLITLVTQHKSILENKKSDAAVWSAKEQCWNLIEEEFNRSSGMHYRSAKTLKAKYEGIKRTTRQKSAVIHGESNATGEGPNPDPLTPVEKQVKDTILFCSVDGIETKFDSEHLGQHTAPKKVPNDQKFTNWKPKPLRPKKHSTLSAEKIKKPFELAEAKLEVIELQKKILEEELINKRKQWAFEEEEREHKREMWDIEKHNSINRGK